MNKHSKMYSLVEEQLDALISRIELLKKEVDHDAEERRNFSNRVAVFAQEIDLYNI